MILSVVTVPPVDEEALPFRRGAVHCARRFIWLGGLFQSSQLVDDRPVFDIEPNWAAVRGSASLAELAASGKPTNYGHVCLHRLLVIVMYGVLTFGMKSVSVLSLFDRKVSTVVSVALAVVFVVTVAIVIVVILVLAVFMLIIIIVVLVLLTVVVVMLVVVVFMVVVVTVMVDVVVVMVEVLPCTNLSHFACIHAGDVWRRRLMQIVAML